LPLCVHLSAFMVPQNRPWKLFYTPTWKPQSWTTLVPIHM
jgi:hypothetical protein